MRTERHSQESGPIRPSRGFSWRHILIALTIFVVTAIALSAMGRIGWCKCGGTFLWSGDIVSTHNSQHVFDPYSFTHVLHGIALYGIVWLFVGSRTTPATRAMIALALEAAWEVFENTSFVIERYREATISLDYYGDSVLNSLSDIAACLVGIALAMTAPIWASMALFVIVEVTLLLWVRDSLLLNIIMLALPLEALKEWQMGRIN